MGTKVYINGEFVEKEQARVSVFDHGLLYGDGVFEGIRAYGGKPFELEEHLERLWESACTLMLAIPISQEEMADAIRRALEVNGLSDAYIRVIVTRGEGTLGLDPDLCHGGAVIVIADKIALYSEEAYRKGLEIVSVSVVRNHPQALDPRVKSLNYLNNVLAKMQGKLVGAPEALMLNHLGYVAECTGDNIFTVRQGDVFTPSVTSGILKGITREVVIGLAREAGLVVHEVFMTLHDIYNAQECFLTGTAAEVIAVTRIDGRVIGDGKPGAVTQDLLKRFRAVTRK